MIPILYDKTETSFTSNGLGRLRDCISAVVTEERNGVYELDFEYPMSAEDFSQIQIGRIVGVTHDDTDDIQPFDIVSYSRPINGVVTFHCVHISYRQSYMTVTGSNINSLADAFDLLATAEPSNPFTYWTDKDSIGYMASADGTPRSVRQMLGGVEGSILDAYGGEYEWDKFLVRLHSSRGQLRNFSIRYGVNMLDYKEDFDSQGTYSSCIPYWTDGETKVVGDRQDSPTATITGRGECVPMDVSDKFESQPTKAEVEAMGLSMLTSRNTALPTQNIHVEFVRLQDLGYEDLSSLMQCKLCDTIKVVFPDYNATGQFKIVKTVWNVLKDRYDSMELGDLSATLSEALGISNGLNSGGSGGGGVSVLDFYPVGSYYETSDTTFDPNITWGGTWSLEAEGLVHIGAGANYTVGDTGGKKSVMLSASIGSALGRADSINFIAEGVNGYQSGHNGTYAVFGSNLNNLGWSHSTPVTEFDSSSRNTSIMQPYIVVNRWHRTA